MGSSKRVNAAKNNSNTSRVRFSWANLTAHNWATGKDRRTHQRIEDSGEYYRIILRPREMFVSFQIHEPDQPNMLLRLSGKRKDGSWSTQAWLINKSGAHVEGDRLVADAEEVKKLLKGLGTNVIQIDEDIFKTEARQTTEI